MTFIDQGVEDSQLSPQPSSTERHEHAGHDKEETRSSIMDFSY